MNASRKIWAGSALAAVALGIVVFASGYPPKAEDLTGTVAPAERYRAPQAGGDAIKLSEPSGSATAVPALTTAGIEAAQADASRTMQKSDAQLQAEKADASRIAQKSDAQLQAEKADASRIAQKNDAQRQAGKADASRIAQKTDAQLQAEKTEASKATAERALN